MDNRYGGVIWTYHALSRLNDRGISQQDAWYTFQHPQNSEYAKTRGAWMYHRIYGATRIEVVAKQNERKEWVILSVWSSLISQPAKQIPGRQKSFIFRLLRYLGKG